jgi:hypothetical protein
VATGEVLHSNRARPQPSEPSGLAGPATILANLSDILALLLLGAEHGGVRVVVLALPADALIVLAQGHLAELLGGLGGQHVLHCVVLANTSKLGSISKLREHFA